MGPFGPDWEAAGLWLIGVGSGLVVVALVAGTPRAAYGRTYGTMASKGDRLRFAVTMAGAALVAGGSFITTVVRFPGWPFAAAVVVLAAVLIHVVNAWKLREYWRHRLPEIERAAETDPEGKYPRTFPNLERGRQRTTWRWCLRHPFNAGEPT